MSGTPAATNTTKNAETREAAAAGRQRRRRRRIAPEVWAGRLLVLVVWLASWEYASGRLIREFFASAPTSIAQRLVDWFSTGLIWPHLWTTFQEMMLGLLLGATLAVVVGFALGRMHRLAEVFEPYVTAIYSLPKLALAPLFILWFGIGLPSKVVLVALIVFFLVFYNTFAGARTVDQLYINTTRIMGGNRRQVYQKVILPSAAVWVLTGLKLAVPYSLIGAIVGELISSNRGLGFIIINSSSLFDTTGVLAALTIIAAISITLNQLVTVTERRVARWQTTGGGAGVVV